MDIIIGSARIDENGNTNGGNAGDQKQKSSTNDTVGEVSMQSFYVHKKGWYVLRPKDADIALKMANAMKTACNNANLGYDQYNRLGVITYGTNTKTKTECDCSSLVRQCIKEASGKDVGNFRTVDEVSFLEKSGLFNDKIAYTSNTKLYTGDVLVTKTSGHTVIVVSGYDRIDKTDVLKVDGLWGPATTKRLQQIFGTTIDRKISNQPKSEKTRNPGLANMSCFEWNDNKTGSNLIKEIQKRIGATQNGWIGYDTIIDMQKWLGTKQDGVISNPSNMVKALQTWCNNQ